ncbi:MAG TPA: hypothetical protein VIM16_24225 [Mucilaginibacter sp.]
MAILKDCQSLILFHLHNLELLLLFHFEECLIINPIKIYTQTGIFLPAIMRYTYAETKQEPVSNKGSAKGFLYLIFLIVQLRQRKKNGIAPI